MRNITFRNIWYSWKYVQKLNENEDIQKNWAGKISSGSWQRLPAGTLPHPRRANFVHVWNLRNIYLLKFIFSALLIILLITDYCDYCLQTFLSTSTVSFAPLLLNIASISSCPYLRDNCLDKTQVVDSLVYLFIYSEFQTVLGNWSEEKWKFFMTCH